MKNAILEIATIIIFIIQISIFSTTFPHTKAYAQAATPAATLTLISTNSAQLTPAIINANTYTIYGGTNPHDTIGPEWTAGSDNVVWDFGQTKMVYRLTKSLSLNYNPAGEFHITRPSPVDVSTFKYLTFVGRTDQNSLDFNVMFIDNNNQPIGTPLKFSRFGGDPADNYWTQYNFPLQSFFLLTPQISGIRITQLSQGWGAVLYLDEVYISTYRGEDINPAVPSPTPTPNPSTTINPLEKQYFPEMNPVLILIPLVVLGVAILFH